MLVLEQQPLHIIMLGNLKSCKALWIYGCNYIVVMCVKILCDQACKYRAYLYMIFALFLTLTYYNF